MRRRTVQMAVVAVTVALLLVGVPLAVLGSMMVWESAHTALDSRTQFLARAVERRLVNEEQIDEAMLTPWIGGEVNPEARIIVQPPEGERVETGDLGTGRVLRSAETTASGARVIMEIRVWDVIVQVGQLIFKQVAQPLDVAPLLQPGPVPLVHVGRGHLALFLPPGQRGHRHP